jgi:type I restriction enzyme R subunit
MDADRRWLVQDRSEANIEAGRGVVIREFPLTRGSGFADYLLYVDARRVKVLKR